MATQFLRAVDRWRFEAPLALALAAAAGFAAMAMPHELFGRVPVVGDHGRLGHAALAVAVALVCGALGYVAMRRPAKPAGVLRDDDYIEDLYAPVTTQATDSPDDGPVRLRRADRHPDAPPRAPIRASRDLGEPFMEVGTPLASVVASEAPVAEEPVAAPVEAPVAYAEPAKLEHPVEDAAEPLEAVEPGAVEPVVETVAELPIAAATVAEAPIDEERIAGPVVPQPIAEPSHDDSSLAAMMERLSAGMQRRGEPVVRPLGSARDKGPALRDALEELNRLAERRG